MLVCLDCLEEEGEELVQAGWLVGQVRTQEELIEGTVEPVGYTICHSCLVLVLFCNLELTTGQALLMLGKLIEQLKCLNRNSEHLMMRKSEEAVGLLLNEAAHLHPGGIIGVLTEKLG